jgi:hypothetical protein
MQQGKIGQAAVPSVTLGDFDLSLFLYHQVRTAISNTEVDTRIVDALNDYHGR